MMTSKTLLLGIAAPLALVLAGVGTTASASTAEPVVATVATPTPPAAGGPVVIFPWPLDCSVILCSPGTYCVDTPVGPTCVPFDDTK